MVPINGVQHGVQCPLGLIVRTCQSNARCPARCARCKALRAGRRRGRDDAKATDVATQTERKLPSLSGPGLFYVEQITTLVPVLFLSTFHEYRHLRCNPNLATVRP